MVMLQGAPNFRPIAGIKSNTVYRSNELSALTDEDLKELKRLRIRTIIDLRTPNERKSRLDRISSDLGIQQISIPILQLNQDVGHFKLFSYLFQNARSLDFKKYIKDFYIIIAYERTLQLKRTLNILSDPNNIPAVIHCTVGKDRTGFMLAWFWKASDEQKRIARSCFHLPLTSFRALKTKQTPMWLHQCFFTNQRR